MRLTGRDLDLAQLAAFRTSDPDQIASGSWTIAPRATDVGDIYGSLPVRPLFPSTLVLILCAIGCCYMLERFPADRKRPSR
jgi:hypothetical protein